MRVEEISADDSLVAFIKKFVLTPQFAAIKDAFVSHTPNADAKSQTSVEVGYGMNRGACYVFNQLEEIARQVKTKKEPERSGGRDPDLES